MKRPSTRDIFPCPSLVSDLLTVCQDWKENWILSVQGFLWALWLSWKSPCSRQHLSQHSCACWGTFLLTWLLQTEGSLLPCLPVGQAGAPPASLSSFVTSWYRTGDRFPTSGCSRKPPRRSTHAAQLGLWCLRLWESETWWHSYVNRITEWFPLDGKRCGAR